MRPPGLLFVSDLPNREHPKSGKGATGSSGCQIGRGKSVPGCNDGLTTPGPITKRKEGAEERRPLPVRRRDGTRSTAAPDYPIVADPMGLLAAALLGRVYVT